jgi:hypothetical protein
MGGGVVMVQCDDVALWAKGGYLLTSVPLDDPPLVDPLVTPPYGAIITPRTAFLYRAE